MEDESQIVKTEVDELVDVVKRHKRLSFEEAAKKLKMPLEVIETWSTFLEEEGVLAIDYRLTTPYLIPAQNAKNAPTSHKEGLEDNIY